MFPPKISEHLKRQGGVVLEPSRNTITADTTYLEAEYVVRVRHGDMELARTNSAVLSLYIRILHGCQLT